MFNGEYRFYRHGELIATHKNLITTAGKAHIMRYLAGANQQIGDSIAVGIGEVVPTLTDARLGFEVDSRPLDQIGVNTVDSKLVFKASLLPGVYLSISEVGLWANRSAVSTTGVGNSRLLTNANPATESWIGATWDANSRLSTESLLLTPAASNTAAAQFSNFTQDLSAYSNSDEFLVAYEAVANVDSMLVYFHTTDQDYYTGTVVNTANGYQIGSIIKNNFVATGAPNWAKIEYLRIGAKASGAGAATARFDSLRVERNVSAFTNSVLVSRSKLATPIVKAASEPLDIEYTVRFSL